MSTVTIDPDRLARLDSITLDHGSHSDFADGHCSMEVVAWLADLGHTDAPPCCSPVLTRFVIRLNDRWGFDQRQKLKPYLPRLVGTAGDGKDDLREKAATAYAADLLVPWLELAGLDDAAAKIKTATADDLAGILYEARRAGWKARDEAQARLVAKVKERLNDQGAAVAVVAAVVDAVAVAAAAAAADAVADAAAAAAADAAVAVAAAVAAAAAAAADADAAVDAAAAAAADAAAAAADRYWNKYDAAYTAARMYYRKHPFLVSQQIADLAAAQDGAALDLLDRLIDPEVAA